MRTCIEERFWSEGNYKTVAQNTLWSEKNHFSDHLKEHLAKSVLATLWHRSQAELRKSGSGEDILDWCEVFEEGVRNSLLLSLKKAKFLREISDHEYEIAGNAKQIKALKAYKLRAEKGGKALRKKYQESRLGIKPSKPKISQRKKGESFKPASSLLQACSKPASSLPEASLEQAASRLQAGTITSPNPSTRINTNSDPVSPHASVGANRLNDPPIDRPKIRGKRVARTPRQVLRFFVEAMRPSSMRALRSGVNWDNKTACSIARHVFFTYGQDAYSDFEDWVKDRGYMGRVPCNRDWVDGWFREWSERQRDSSNGGGSENVPPESQECIENRRSEGGVGAGIPQADSAPQNREFRIVGGDNLFTFAEGAL